MRYRDQLDYTPQQVTRIPAFRPGDRVRIRGEQAVPTGTVRSLAGALREGSELVAWQVFLTDGRSFHPRRLSLVID